MLYSTLFGSVIAFAVINFIEDRNKTYSGINFWSIFGFIIVPPLAFLVLYFAMYRFIATEIFIVAALILSMLYPLLMCKFKHKLSWPKSIAYTFLVLISMVLGSLILPLLMWFTKW